MSEGSMLWGGRFERGPHPEMVALTRSIDFDMELLEEDATVTKAHARVLVAAGLLDAGELGAIDEVLDDLVARRERGELVPAPTDEDVHTLVERELTEALGDTGRRIHAGRSRNDLVVTDVRLWCKAHAAEAVDELRGLIELIASFAEGQAETVLPGYTHLQRAQPVSVGFHVLAHGFALARDLLRFRNAYACADKSSLGAGAVAGNTLGLDPQVAADELGFSATFENAMDAVADRDFLVDLVYACASCTVHLSRFAEDLVLWTSSEFGFARLADEWSTGSSMMPQKRNPDLAELVRARAATAIAELGAVLSLLKGLPLAYNRDLQEDKLHLFRAQSAFLDCVRSIRGLLGALRFDKEAMLAAAGGSGTWATDLAEALVRRGVPFREAHEAAGTVVALLETQQRELASLSDGELAAIHPALAPQDRALADPAACMARRDSPGGTAPARVAEQVTRLRAAVAHALA